MSLTLGLNTALSGLLANQRGLDVIAQNVVNVNTPGYTRKTMNLESRVLAGKGAGVQEGDLTRVIDEGLLKDIRAQASNFGKFDVEQQFFTRINDLFGSLDQNSSIAHRVQSLLDGFEVLATEVHKPSVQWDSVQAGLDVSDLLGSMTDQIQALRLEADRSVEEVVSLINEQLTNIGTLNGSIVRNTATNTPTGDLEDKRDVALSTLAKYMDITYFKRNDNSMIVYSRSGDVLVDNNTATLSHAATTTSAAWMSLSGGHFNKITIDAMPDDIGPNIVSGELRALLDMRDKTLVDLQSQLDALALTMKEKINQVHNRGTILPTAATSYTGTRVFATQGTITHTTTEAAATLSYHPTSTTVSTVTAAAGGGNADGYGTLSFSYNAAGTVTITAGAANDFTGISAGDTISIHGATAGANDGSYVVESNDGQVLTVRKVNALQTISLGGTTDSVIALFDANGDQIAKSTLNTIMTTDYTAAPYNAAPYNAAPYSFDSTDPEMAAKASRGPWNLGAVSKHVEVWLKLQGYTSASVGLNSDNKMAISTGSSTVSLVFRDQGTSTYGADAADATINFDTDGDGETDESVSGLANFFGLNDFFTASGQRSLFESEIKDDGYQLPTLSPSTLRLYDGTGQIGNSLTIAAGSTLQDIADQINDYTQTTESALLGAKSWTTTSAVTITVSDANSTVTTATIAAGTVTLANIAAQLSTSTCSAAMVRDGSDYRLRVFDTRGVPLTVTFSGGAIGASNLGTTLNMTRQHRISASVVPEGSGYRLRLIQGDDKEMFVASDLTASNTSVLTELGLQHGASRIAGQLDLRTDIQSAPEKISRGKMQWNSDLSEYFLSEGDNTVALELAETMGVKNAMESAGAISAGRYSFAQYASSSVSLISSMASHSKDLHTYQKTLNESLDSQYTSYSGVNIDEEVAKMIDFQQAYSASARVISAIQQMLEELVNTIR